MSTLKLIVQLTTLYLLLLQLPLHVCSHPHGVEGLGGILEPEQGNLHLLEGMALGLGHIEGGFGEDIGQLHRVVLHIEAVAEVGKVVQIHLLLVQVEDIAL